MRVSEIQMVSTVEVGTRGQKISKDGTAASAVMLTRHSIHRIPRVPNDETEEVTATLGKPEAIDEARLDFRKYGNGSLSLPLCSESKSSCHISHVGWESGRSRK